MQAKLKKWLKKYWAHLVIALVWAVIVATNYEPGTWLSGWDNLHPEWKPGHDLWRSFNSLWQEYQGLGLLGGMAHASDLVRQVMVLVLSTFLPSSLIRYLLLFAMLLLGSLGCFKLFSIIFAKQTEKPYIYHCGALFSALFYLLNLGTVQNFYVAFEPFYWFYGFLPWLLLLFFQAWQKNDPQSWLKLFLVSFLATPLSYVQTNFVVYALVLFISGVVYFLLDKNQAKIVKIKQLIISLAVVIISNLFWLLPMAYFVLSGGTYITSANHINQIATPEMTTQNAHFANLLDILLLRGYWLSYDDYNVDSGQHELMMGFWASFLPTRVFSYVFAILMLAGLVRVIVKQKNYKSIAIILIFVAMTVLLLINNLNIPLISQIFRSPFTKVIAVLSLCYSLLAGYGFLWLEKITSKKLANTSFLLVVVLLMLYSWPAFRGNFIYHQLRVKIPDVYQEVFNYFDTLPEKQRVAVLPSDSIFGWQFNDWGYRGIGFYHFGLKQALLNRPFDVWNDKNEDFFQEIYYANTIMNGTLFEQVLAKYDVRYLLIDESIFEPGQEEKSLYRWQDLLGRTSCVLSFEESFLKVYDCGKKSESFIRTPNYLLSSTDQKDNFYDPIYHQYGTYAKDKTETQVDFPFSYLYSREIERHEINYDYLLNNDYLEITIGGYHPSENYKELVVPGLDLSKNNQFVLTGQIENDILKLYFEPSQGLAINDQPLELFPNLALDLPITSKSSALYLDFGTDIVTLDPSATTPAEHIVTLGGLNENQEWKYFFAEDARIREDQGLEVTKEDIYIASISAETWTEFAQPQTLPITEPIAVVSGYFVSYEEKLRGLVANEELNCDVNGRGSARKEEWSDGTIAYFADHKANACDSFMAKDMDLNSGSYLVQLKAGNVSGRALSYYFLDNRSSNTLWETVLRSPYDERTFSFAQFSNASNENNIFSIHSSSRSLAGELSRNELLLTAFYKAPLTWLAGIELRGQSGEIWTQNNPLLINQVKTSDTSSYNLTITREQPGPALIELTQSFHPGWEAKLNGQKLEHIKVNDWSNGWLIEPDQCTDQCPIKITFWPQWLGWSAMLVSGVRVASAIILIIKYSLQKKTPPVKPAGL